MRPETPPSWGVLAPLDAVGAGLGGGTTTGPPSERRSASTRLTGDFFSRWTVVWSPSGSGIFHSSSESHSHRSAVREVGARLVEVVPGDPADAEDGRAVAGQDDIAAGDPLGEVEDLVGRPADLLGAAGIPLPEQPDEPLLRRGVLLVAREVAQVGPADGHARPVPHQRPAVPRPLPVGGADPPVAVRLAGSWWLRVVVRWLIGMPSSWAAATYRPAQR